MTLHSLKIIHFVLTQLRVLEKGILCANCPQALLGQEGSDVNSEIKTPKRFPDIGKLSEPDRCVIDAITLSLT